jgi:hypothetical protein
MDKLLSRKWFKVWPQLKKSQKLMRRKKKDQVRKKNPVLKSFKLVKNHFLRLQLLRLRRLSFLKTTTYSSISTMFRQRS